MKFLIARCLCAILIVSTSTTNAAEKERGVVTERRISELETPVVDLIGKSSLYVVEKMPWLSVQFRAATNSDSDL